MYFWVKAFHLIFVVSWFAGLFYLPRLFINITLSDEPAVKAQLNIMSRKLYRFVTPFMFLTIIFGVWMVWLNPQGYMASGWFHVKMTLVLLVVIYHFVCGHYRKQLEQHTCQKSSLFFRIFNEVLVLLLFAIIILAVVKPF